MFNASASTWGSLSASARSSASSIGSTVRVVPADEERDPAELGCDGRELGISGPVCQRGERSFEHLQSVLGTAREPQRLGNPAGDARGGTLVVHGLQQPDCLLEPVDRSVELAGLEVGGSGISSSSSACVRVSRLSSAACWKYAAASAPAASDAVLVRRRAQASTGPGSGARRHRDHSGPRDMRRGSATRRCLQAPPRRPALRAGGWQRRGDEPCGPGATASSTQPGGRPSARPELPTIGREPILLHRENLLTLQGFRAHRRWPVSPPASATIPSRVNVAPSTLARATTRFSSGVNASSLAATRACSEAGAPRASRSRVAPSAGT